MVPTGLLLERAWLGDAAGGTRDDVLVEIADGRFTRVEPDAAAPEATRVPGLTIPGLANGHSHAFHRALRGRTQRGRATFRTWREEMYAAAAHLDPDSYRALAAAVFAEMVAAGFTTVGEFHYLHHQPDGTPYADPNAMGHALVSAAHDAGIRLVLLDTCYLSSGFGEPPVGVQLRYSDGDADAWAARVADVRHEYVGAAIHSVRAVPRDQIAVVVGTAPLHVQVSEQQAENDACRAAYGVTGVQLLHDEGALGPDTTAVHATHLSAVDVRLLSHGFVCLTPTTERDLAHGIGPAGALRRAGARLVIGTGSHAVIDPFEELRALEGHERRATHERGRFTAAALMEAATAHRSLGVPDAGRIEVGARADLVTLDTVSPRTAGTGADEHTAVYAARAADVTRVVVDGRVVFDGDPDRRAAIGRDLDEAVGRLHRSSTR